jgi:hypothetical protein
VIGAVQYRVKKVELISLLKHPEPVVYSFKEAFGLPGHSAEARKAAAMDQLENTPTRPLNAFEAKALKEIQGGKDLVIEDLSLAGALRADVSCVKCHDAKKGDLLGVLSYDLQSGDDILHSETRAKNILYRESPHLSPLLPMLEPKTKAVEEAGTRLD